MYTYILTRAPNPFFKIFIQIELTWIESNIYKTNRLSIENNYIYINKASESKIFFLFFNRLQIFVDFILIQDVISKLTKTLINERENK